jgi:hypothetical protein
VRRSKASLSQFRVLRLQSGGVGIVVLLMTASRVPSSRSAVWFEIRSEKSFGSEELKSWAETAGTLHAKPFSKVVLRA